MKFPILQSRKAGYLAIACLTLSFGNAQAQSYSGSIEARAIHADGNKLLEDEEDANRSAWVLQAEGDARWIRGKHATRLSLSSAYHNYTDDDRDDRWNNELELAHAVSLSPTVELNVSASIGSNYSTLEYRSADQVALESELFYQPSRNHRFSVEAGYRHREYDDSTNSSGQSPYVGASYRYRPNNRHRYDISSRLEWVEADNNAYDLSRQRISGYYTFRPDRKNRYRFGLVGQNWEHDSRLVRGGDEQLHRWRIQPQVRYTRSLPGDVSLELDYRHDFSRSNDSTREEDGKRLMISLRKDF